MKKIAILSLVIGALLSLLFGILWRSTIGINVETWIYQTFTKSDAKKAYLKGREHYLKFGSTDLDNARLYYERAIELAPDYPFPYAGLAELYTAWSYLCLPYGKNTEELKKEAIKYGITSISINSRLFETKRAVAFSLNDLTKTKANKLAEEYINKALRLKPNDSEAKYIKWVSRGKLLDDPFVNEVLTHDYDFILPM